MSSKYEFQYVAEECFVEAVHEENKDLGEQLRKQVKQFTNPESLATEVNDKLCKQVDALERLANNTYGKKYQRVHKSTATGLTAEQCNQVLSSEFLQYLNDDKGKKKFL